MGDLLITGATGNVGAALMEQLCASGTSDIRVGAYRPDGARERLAHHAGCDFEVVSLNFEQPETFNAALRGVDRVFLMRPPKLSDVGKYIAPFIDAAKMAGVRHIVFLSLLGAEKNRVVPHHKIEKLIMESGIAYTFLRASFFMQNLNTTHRDEIVHGEIAMPAGDGRTSFIDVRDIAAVAALALTTPGHENRAYDLTGSEALSYGEVAHIMTDVLGKPIRYTNPNPIKFVRAHLKMGETLPFALLMTALYTTARLGLAGRVTDDTARLLGRLPITVAQYVRDYAKEWG